MTISYRMPFGKYRGVPVTLLPDSYLCWLYSECDLYEPIASAIDAEYWRRFGRQEHHDNPPAPKCLKDPALLAVADQIVAAGYKKLAVQTHPDHGGTHEDMLLLNRAVDYLRDQLKGAA